MKKWIISIFLVFLLAVFAAADNGYISYAEGDVSISKSGAPRLPAAIGDPIFTGDTIYTAANSVAEITYDSGSSVSIQGGSAFNIGETADPEAPSRKKGFFRVLLGAVSFKFRNLTEEPDIGTPLTVCSVRGTDFTVFTGPDGASMTVVSDGLVEVTSGGMSAMLSAGEGIEAVVGLGLGEPFEAQQGYVRYDEFVEDALARIDEDPVGIIIELTDQLVFHAEEGEFFLKSWNTNYEKVKEVRSEVARIKNEDGTAKADEFESAELSPLQLRSLDLNRTYRHHFISALVLRRFTYSSLYVQMRTRYLTDPGSAEWIKFKDAFSVFLGVYEDLLIPNLEKEDL